MPQTLVITATHAADFFASMVARHGDDLVLFLLMDEQGGSFLLSNQPPVEVAVDLVNNMHKDSVMSYPTPSAN